MEFDFDSSSSAAEGGEETDCQPDMSEKGREDPLPLSSFDSSHFNIMRGHNVLHLLPSPPPPPSVDEVYANDRGVDYYSGRELWPRLSLEEGNGRLISV